MTDIHLGKDQRSNQKTQGSKEDNPKKTSKIDRLPDMFSHIGKNYVWGILVMST